jgi:hypothetical protein
LHLSETSVQIVPFIKRRLCSSRLQKRYTVANGATTTTMPETQSSTRIEAMAEHPEGGHSGRLRLEVMEIIKGVILALVAVGTAWSG